MSRQPEAIRARALAFASILVREVGFARSRSRASGDALRLSQLADDNARLRELLVQPPPPLLSLSEPAP